MIAVLTYLACIALWALSTILMIWKKFPWCALFLFLLHLWELLTVGLKTGREYGEKDSVSIASCLCFGFLFLRCLSCSKLPLVFSCFHA